MHIDLQIKQLAVQDMVLLGRVLGSPPLKSTPILLPLLQQLLLYVLVAFIAYRRKVCIQGNLYCRILLSTPMKHRSSFVSENTTVGNSGSRSR